MSNELNKISVVGVMKEIKPQEGRVAIVPSQVHELTKKGHQILIGKDAGKASGFEDKLYKQAGAKIMTNTVEIWDKSDLIVQVKEPVKEQLKYLKQNKENSADKILFTYLHLASPTERDLTIALLNSHITAIAYETLQKKNSMGVTYHPLLQPMSAIAGALGVEMGIYFLGKNEGGLGVLPGQVYGIDNKEKSTVVIIGGGEVGTAAAKRALDIGAKVILLEKNSDRIKKLKNDKSLKGMIVWKSDNKTVVRASEMADILIGAVYISGNQAPKLITKKIMKGMKQGAVIVDVPIDQGGLVEGGHATTHDKPVYFSDFGQVIYSVANMPGRVPRTSTLALTEQTFPYTIKLANQGLEGLKTSAELKSGLNTMNGKVMNKGVAKAHGL